MYTKRILTLILELKLYLVGSLNTVVILILNPKLRQAMIDKNVSLLMYFGFITVNSEIMAKNAVVLAII